MIALACTVPCTAFAAPTPAVDNTEVEDNESLNDATIVQMNQKFYGVIDGYNDVDSYMFEAPENGTLLITFTSEYAADSGSTRLNIYDKYHDRINTDYGGKYVSCETLRPQIFTCPVKKGTNYVRISGGNSFGYGVAVHHPYSIKLDYSVESPTLIASKTKAGSKKAQVGWLGVKNASGYQVRCAASKSALKTAKVYTTTAKTKTFTNLKSNKKYYAQVRTTFIAGGVTYYSSWATTKALKTK